jgi:hypothetical protein
MIIEAKPTAAPHRGAVNTECVLQLRTGNSPYCVFLNVWPILSIILFTEKASHIVNMVRILS